MTAHTEAPAQRGYWFPLLVFGGLTALWLPLWGLTAPLSGFVALQVPYPTLTQAIYAGDVILPWQPGPAAGWYWVAMVATGTLLSVAWYRWRDRRERTRTPLRGFLITGLAMTALTAALPLLGLGVPVGADPRTQQQWAWLNAAWRLGTLALLAGAACLAMLARIIGSRALTAITIGYTAAACLSGWLDLRLAGIDPLIHPYDGIIAVLPATVLLLAGLSAGLTAGLRRLRARPAAA
ncbi:MAG: hypothetical protein ACYCO9_01880 [Streptosporangiaceae bacterium]